MAKINKQENLFKFHRENILKAAEELFIAKGLERTTMNDIAERSDYSKSTIYVYFTNKEEIFYNIILHGFMLLKKQILKAIKNNNSFKLSFFSICNMLIDFQEQNPFYFSYIFDLKDPENTAVASENKTSLSKIIVVSDEINSVLIDFFQRGIDNADLREDLDVKKIVLLYRVSITALIRFAVEKKKYIANGLDFDPSIFLPYSFEHLYSIIEKTPS